LQIVCLDLEGFLIPEIWIEFSSAPRHSGAGQDHARRSRIYDKLMRGRIDILGEAAARLPTSRVIAGMAPLAARASSSTGCAAMPGGDSVGH